MYLLHFLLLCTVEHVAQDLFKLFLEFCNLYVQYTAQRQTLYGITQRCNGLSVATEN